MTCPGSHDEVEVQLELEPRSPLWSSSCQLGTGTGVPSRLLDAAGDTSLIEGRDLPPVWPQGLPGFALPSTLCVTSDNSTPHYALVHHLTSSLAPVVLNFLTTKNPVIFPSMVTCF